MLGYQNLVFSCILFIIQRNVVICVLYVINNKESIVRYPGKYAELSREVWWDIKESIVCYRLELWVIQ